MVIIIFLLISSFLLYRGAKFNSYLVLVFDIWLSSNIIVPGELTIRFRFNYIFI